MNIDHSAISGYLKSPQVSYDVLDAEKPLDLKSNSTSGTLTTAPHGQDQNTSGATVAKLDARHTDNH